MRDPRDDACPEVTAGFDTDDDGTPDSLFSEDDSGELFLHTDLDGDGLADRTLALRADGDIDAAPCDDDPPTLVEVLTRLLRWG
ncbi:hypothetical protein [Pseudonocardia hydrocarbonoxydans]|uniref:Uncharacterized protein n=1 Tax=Pseudonocardia hydrocarbonoxydans TaxID=76726 RepID=A0A4Y3WRH2_9PSEU|nr:hypothetical protein [Pseudonocardia hydrocarbonoxydans]GEC21487.1 hypothetical protein PHY01_37700 [Pseudonocardia hydrocarbonoxydans]